MRARLGLRGRARHAFRTLIVHYENDVALQVEERYVNPAVAPGYLGVDFESVTAHDYLMDAAPLQRVEHRVRAAGAAAPVAALLGLEVGAPVLLIERITWSRGQRASFARLHHPGSRFELHGVFDL